MKKISLIILLNMLSLVFTSQRSIAQTVTRIALVSDGPPAEEGSREFMETIKTEIELLLHNRHSFSFSEHFGNYDVQSTQNEFDQLFQDSLTDIIIGVGPSSCGLLTLRKSFPKPTLASIIIDQQLQNIPITPEGTSGIPNFSYTASPFNFERDLQTLHQIFPFKKLGIIGGPNLLDGTLFFGELIGQVLSQWDANYVMVPFVENVDQVMNQLDSEVDAVYILPLLNEEGTASINTLLSQINERKLPSATLFGESYLQAGALMAHESEKNLLRIPRRIALNILKIVEGINPSELPVSMENYNENLMINMATARSTEIYPNFDIMARATMVNINEIPTDRTLNLQATITEALQNNLGLRIASADPKIAEKDVALAKSDLLPQVDISTSFSVLDDNTASTSFGRQGKMNWLASANLSQIIYSEPVLANVAIQELLKESAEQALTQTQLDVVVDASSFFLNVLRAESNLRIQQQNVAVTKENYDISKTKEAVGYTGASDLNRWVAELALKNIDLNDAMANLAQSKLQLNQLLNRPIDEEFKVENATLESQMQLVAEGFFSYIENYGDLQKLADFLVKDALNRLPEIKQLDAGIGVQKRLELSQQRAFYLPSVALSGQGNRTLGKYNVMGDIPATENVLTWNFGLGVQYPILQGGARKHALDQTKLSILQLEDQKTHLNNQLEVRIRANIIELGTALARVQLYNEAVEASKKNFEIVQNSYNEGQVNITTLIDAQKNALQTELAAVNAVYTFILDFLNMERAIGFFFFLAPPAEMEAFFNRMNVALIQE